MITPDQPPTLPGQGEGQRLRGAATRGLRLVAWVAAWLAAAAWAQTGAGAPGAPAARASGTTAVTDPVSEPWPVRAGADPAPLTGPVPRAGMVGAARAVDAEPEGLLARLTRQPLRLVSAGRTLGDLQGQLEAALGVRLTLTSGAANLTVSGEIAGEDGMALVRELAARLRLDWAIGRDGIFLAPEGSARAVVFNAPSAVVASRAAFLANQEFLEMGSGIRVVGRNEEITVTGIPAWINQVAALRVPALADFVQRTMAQQAARKASAAAEAEAAEAARNNPLINLPAAGASAAGEPLSLMVFRLNNAYVDDKKVTVGSSSVTIQGVASLFRQFTGLGGGDTPGQGAGGDGGGAARLPRMDPLAGGRGTGRAERDDEGARAPARGAGASSASQPAVIADSRMNALMVRDRASMLEPYKALVKVLDQPTDMVQLDAFVIDIKASRLDEFGLGLSWGGSARMNSPNLAPGGAAPAGANLILQAARGAQLLAQIRALETKGESEILTVPSVVTLNNLEATFSARQSFFVKVSGNQDASLTKVTAETLLKVTPLVSLAAGAGGNSNGSDRRIRLLISIQDGSVDASSSAVVDNLPRTLENQISTQAVVRGGDTLVIGGQVVRKRVNRVSGLPIIKDIPLLGALTNSRSDDYEQYVRVYVVRPRILGDDSALLNEPVAANAADPMVHGIVGRVPELIRGSGLSPQGTDAARPASGREAGESMLVVPVPQPVAPPVVPINEPRSAGARDRAGSAAAGGQTEGTDRGERNDKPGKADKADKADKTDKPDKGGKPADEAPDDWNSDDPIWRPPGTPLRLKLMSVPAPAAPRAGAATGGGSAGMRVDNTTQASRDREARQILEAELKRGEQQVLRLLGEPAQDSPSMQAALARARGDVQALRSELARLSAPASSTASSASTAAAGPGASSAPMLPATALPQAPASPTSPTRTGR